jgi:hypothetical protein
MRTGDAASETKFGNSKINILDDAQYFWCQQNGGLHSCKNWIFVLMYTTYLLVNHSDV